MTPSRRPASAAGSAAPQVEVDRLMRPTVWFMIRQWFRGCTRSLTHLSVTAVVAVAAHHRVVTALALGNIC